MTTQSHRRRSKVWLAFLPEGAEDERAICRVCSEEIPPKGDDQTEKCSAAKLWKHLNHEHPEVSKMLAGINQEDVMNDGIMDQWNLAVDVLQKQTSKGFTSKVWKFFTLEETDKNISICCECNARISRGCDKNTTSMWNHVKVKHPDVYLAAQGKEDEEEPEEESGVLAAEKAAVRDQFLLYSTRQNSYICRTCGTIMRLESPDEQINTNRLYKHLDNIFHKRVQHGLEPPKRPILPKYYSNSAKVEKKKKTEEKLVVTKKLPAPFSTEKIIADRETDMVHSAVIMRTLYEQQKQGMCCDCTILIPHKGDSKTKSNIERKPIEKGDGTIECFETTSGYEFQVHACVLIIASGRIKTLLETSGSKTIMMHDVTKESLLAFIEIIYLGKLKRLMRLSETEICDIYCAAQSFDSSLVMKYLERECPEIIEKYSASEKSESSTYSKFSLLLPTDIVNGENKDSGVAIPKHFEMHGASGLSLLSSTDKGTSKRSRRKRKPLSSTFRLVESKKQKKEGSDESSDSELGYSQAADENFSNGAEENYMGSGNNWKFEIKGDTAILRGSPDDFQDEMVNFNSSNGM